MYPEKDLLTCNTSSEARRMAAPPAAAASVRLTAPSPVASVAPPAQAAAPMDAAKSGEFGFSFGRSAMETASSQPFGSNAFGRASEGRVI